MYNQDILIQAGVSSDQVNDVTSEISLQDNEKEGRFLVYQYDDASTVVMAVNPSVELLSIHSCIDSSQSSLVDFPTYTVDDNSVAIIKEDNSAEIWIREKSAKLLSLLRAEDVESGISGASEIFVKRALEENNLLALHMINQVYYFNLGNAHVQIGILHLSSHIDYDIGKPILQTIALAALSDRSDDVKDYAVQCYENWNHKDGLKALETIHTDTIWLQSYIDSVMVALREKFPEVETTQ